MVLIQLILIVVLLILGYYGYTVIMKKPFIPSFLKSPTSSSSPQGTGDLSVPASDPSFPGMCEFEGEDVFNKSLYTYDGSMITKSDTVIKCADCPKYLFKDDSGCVPYTYDAVYNKDNKKETGMCTPSLGASKKCPVKK